MVSVRNQYLVVPRDDALEYVGASERVVSWVFCNGSSVLSVNPVWVVPPPTVWDGNKGVGVGAEVPEGDL